MLKSIPKKIIVRMPNWIGDLVMATPVLKSLRVSFKEAEITAMCQSNLAVLLQEDPNIDQLYTFTKPSGFHRRDLQRDIIQHLQFGHYDLGILLTNSFSSAWLFYRAKVKNRTGYAKHYRKFLLNYSRPYPKHSEHLVETYQKLIASIGVSTEDHLPSLYLSKEEQKGARNLLTRYGVKDGDVVIGINPSAAYGPAKCWPVEKFRKLAEKLDKHPNYYIFFLGDQHSIEEINQICQDISSKIISLAGKTNLRELIALIDAFDFFISNDSGPMHIAAALRTDLIALFGSTSALETGPFQFGKVIQKKVSCSPCFKKVCPIDFRCMKRIEVDEVYNEIIRKIGDK